MKKVIIFIFLVGIISCNNKLSRKEKQDYISKGKEITQASFKELSTNLMVQMKLGGPAQAVPFCNHEAMPITNKMAKKFNVTIKRTSDKIRNPKNKASVRELKIIKEYKFLIQNKKEVIPIVELDEGNLKHFYAPIKLNAKCLTCHGKLEGQLSIKTDSLIKSLYLNDKAIGYNEGDLRGIWSIAFKN
ncbi:MAG: DUF3365 domain-containing protein [Lutibacter sp.]|uniref:Tll0287-like domain-containing protein n=1 Tax=Lutibacter sp. TaxID=1925666 RepID=UPI00385E0992